MFLQFLLKIFEQISFILEYYFYSSNILMSYGNIKVVINGIAFIKNLENVLMVETNQYYCANPDIADKYVEFKILINEYVLKIEKLDLDIISSSQRYQGDNVILGSFLQKIYLELECFLIINQKIFYEYIEYMIKLKYWFGNSKILLNKYIINASKIAELHYNIELELLLESQNESLKTLLFFFTKYEAANNIYWINGTKEITLVHLLKNYFKLFKENPYKINTELLSLYKNYPKTNILNYGLNYDIKIFNNNNFLLKNHGLEIAKNNVSYFNDNASIFNYKNIEVNQRYFKNNLLDLNKFQIQIIDLPIMQRRSLERDSIINLYFKQIDESSKAFEIPTFDYYIKGIRKKEFKLTVDPKKRLYFGLFGRETRVDSVVKVFGGYSYWWAWHQDATHLYGKKGAGGGPIYDDYTKWVRNEKIKHLLIYKAKYIKKIKHGAHYRDFYNNWLYKKLGWDQALRRSKWLLRYITHGRESLEMQKIFFKNILLSDDLWVKKSVGRVYKTNKLFVRNVVKYYGRDWDFHNGDTIVFWGLDFNRPRISHRKRLKLPDYLFAAHVDSKKIFKKLQWSSRGLNELSKLVTMNMNALKESKQANVNGVRAAWTKEYATDSFLLLDRIKWRNNIQVNNLSWNIFYTNITNVSESFNLSYINKNVYGRHVWNETEKHLVSKQNLYSKVDLPKKRKVLIKKEYIVNLISVYENEEKPIIDYIKYKQEKSEIFWSILDFFFSFYNVTCMVIKNFINDYISFFNYLLKRLHLVLQGTTGVNQILKLIKYYYKHYKNYEDIIWPIIVWGSVLLFYIVTSSLLAWLIKSILPNKLIYGVKLRKEEKKKSLESLLNWLSFSNDLSGKRIFDKSWFNAEPKYIYTREGKKKFVKTLVKNKLEERVKEQVIKNFHILYEKFLFEENLEKLENNTKMRFDIFSWREYYNLTKSLIWDSGIWETHVWTKKEDIKNYEILNRVKVIPYTVGKIIEPYVFFKLIFKGIFFYYKDKKYNYNRKILWLDSTLDKESSVIYYYNIPNIFSNFFFILRFLKVLSQVWNWRYWDIKFQQFAKYGVASNLNYKEIEKSLDNIWVLEWYKARTDYGTEIIYLEYLTIMERLNKIFSQGNTELLEKKRTKNEIILSIAKRSSKIAKLNKIKEFQDYILTWQNDKVLHFENLNKRSVNIREELKLEAPKITKKQWAEQELRFIYRLLVEKKKKELVTQEASVVRETKKKMRQRDFDEIFWSLEVLDTADVKDVLVRKGVQMLLIEQETQLRKKNYENGIIDKALDIKEKIFFEEIPDYNKELEEAYSKIYEADKIVTQNTTFFEKTVQTLYDETRGKKYIAYRYFTTIGGRLSYIVSLYFGLFRAWIADFKKIRKNNYSVENLLLIIRKDLSDYIYKIYWEYIFIWKKYKAFKNLGYRFFDILQFSVLILTPLFLVGGGLYVIIFVYVFIQIKQKKILGIWKSLFLKKNREKTQWKILNILSSLSLLFRNEKTGETVIAEIYRKFYMICMWCETLIYYIKGAFLLGYTQKNIQLGLVNVLNYLKLRFYTFLKRKKLKKIEKKQIFELFIIKKNKLAWRLNVLITILKLNYNLSYIHWVFVHFVYKFIIYPILKIEKIEFLKLYNSKLLEYKKYFNKILLNLWALKFALDDLSLKDLILLLSKELVKILLLPINLWISVIKADYVNKYEKGIEGFWNPSTIKNKKIGNWKWKIHRMLLDEDLSRYFEEKKVTTNFLENYLIYKKETSKISSPFYKQYWKQKLWNYKLWKKKILVWLTNEAEYLESNYKAFEEALETKNFSFFERVRYLYQIYKLRNITLNKKEVRKIKNISRDLFFKNRVKMRKVLMRRYFLKGLINWITYITIRKVFFTKIHELKPENLRIKKRKYKFIKYRVYQMSETQHIGTYLKNTPPQLWSLVIINEFFIKQNAKYGFGLSDTADTRAAYPLHWNSKLEFSKELKWRMGNPIFGTAPTYRQKTVLTLDENTSDLNVVIKNLSKEPYDPLLRWGLFLLECGLTFEDMSDEAIDIWGDVSLEQLLTYDWMGHDLQHEIKEFKRVIETGNTFFAGIFKLKRSLADYYTGATYEDRYDTVWNTLLLKNKKILDEVLVARQSKSVKIYYKALRKHVVKSEEQADLERRIDQSRDYFYEKKRQLFDELGIEDYLDWKAEWGATRWEDKMYRQTHLAEVKALADTITENYENKPGRLKLGLFLDNLAFLSFDQTLSEIIDFLKFEVLEIVLENNKNEKAIINYKHVNVKNPSIIDNINWMEHEHKMSEETHFQLYDEKKKLNKQQGLLLEKYSYITGIDKVEWEVTSFNVDNVTVANNYFFIYYETGDYYTYNDKIKYNTDAKTFKKPESYFHGNPIVLHWIGRIKRRKFSLRNLRKKKKSKLKRINERGMSFSLMYINNIRWSWEQWIAYGDTETENFVLNKNIILFNERYRFWNIKRNPIRVKLPVSLYVQEDLFRNLFLKAKTGIYNKYEFNYFLLGKSISPILKASMNFQVWRETIEKHYGRDLADILFWIISNFDEKVSVFDKDDEVAKSPINEDYLKLRKESKLLAKDLITNLFVFDKIYFAGFATYSWDLIRYHDLFVEVDEFPFGEYFNLKQQEYLFHDPEIRRMMEVLDHVVIDRYNPISYWFFHVTTNSFTIYYKIFAIIPYICTIWVLDVIFYHPGEYIWNIFNLIIPIMLGLISWFIKRFFRQVRNIKDGFELYLYKYHSYVPKTLEEEAENIENFMEELDETTEFWTDGNDDVSDITNRDKENLKNHEDLEIDILTGYNRNRKWWRAITHINKDYEPYTLRAVLWLLFNVLLPLWLIDWWFVSKFRHRNFFLFWDFYKEEEIIFHQYVEGAKSRHYRTKSWWLDSWKRLEAGGNGFSLRYVNTYRIFQDKELMTLDYGYPGQYFPPLKFPWKSHNRTVMTEGSYADVKWLRLIQYLNPDLPVNWKSLIITRDSMSGRPKPFLFKRLGFYARDLNLNRLDDWSEIEGLGIFNFFRGVFKRKFRQLLIEWILGVEYTARYSKIRRWVAFKRKLLHKYDYDVADRNLHDFVYDANNAIVPIIKRDVLRYKSGMKGDDTNIVNLNFKRATKIALDKNLSFKTGKSLSKDALASITENDKHMHILYHNFLKYKLQRLEYYLLHLKECHQLEINSNNKANILEIEVEINNVIKNINDTEIFFKKNESYLQNIFKKVSFDQYLEYKTNTILIDVKTSTVNFQNRYDVDMSVVLKYLDILIKIISNWF